MAKKDPRVDAYIAKAAPFAQPILKRLRRVVHAGCPGVVETLKWNAPAFEHHGILAGMAAFKRHCIFGFWRHALLEKQFGLPPRSRAAWGTFGRITDAAQLPPDRAMVRYVKVAAALNEQGVRVAPPKPKPGRAVRVPADLVAALKRNRKALARFETFPPSHRKDYVEWITGAKRAETRARRVATAVEWIALGRGRNWKYERSRE